MCKANCTSVMILSTGLQPVQMFTCEPVIPDARRNIPCRDDLCRHKVLLCAVHLHAVVALHEDNAEEESTDHLGHQYKQQPFAHGEMTENETKVPSVVDSQTGKLIPAMLWTLQQQHLAIKHTASKSAF